MVLYAPRARESEPLFVFEAPRLTITVEVVWALNLNLGSWTLNLKVEGPGSKVLGGEVRQPPAMKCLHQ